jgi:hypothetical protein
MPLSSLNDSTVLWLQSEECIQKTAQTMQYLSNDGASQLVLTGTFDLVKVFFPFSPTFPLIPCVCVDHKN